MKEHSLSGNNNYKFSLRMGGVPADTYNKTPKLGENLGVLKLLGTPARPNKGHHR